MCVFQCQYCFCFVQNEFRYFDEGRDAQSLVCAGRYIHKTMRNIRARFKKASDGENSGFIEFYYLVSYCNDIILPLCMRNDMLPRVHAYETEVPLMN